MDNLINVLGFSVGVLIGYFIWRYSDKLGDFLVDIIKKIKK